MLHNRNLFQFKLTTVRKHIQKDNIMNEKNNRTGKSSPYRDFKKASGKPEFKVKSTHISNHVTRTKKLDIERLDENLCGIADFKGKIFRVKNTLPGERVEVELPHIKDSAREKAYVYTPVRLIETSPDRCEVKCSYANDCSNCNLLHCKYAAQLRIKTQMLNNTLKAAGESVPGVVALDQFGYRNKVHLAFTEVDRKVLVGFFNEETNRVVPVRRCQLHGAWFEKLANILNTWATDNRLSAFKPWEGQGLLRFAVCRHLKGRIMVTVVARENIRCMDKLLSILQKDFKDVSLYLNINTQADSKVFSPKFIHCGGEKKLKGNMLDVEFLLSPNSFFQVNEQISSEIYKKVLEYADSPEISTVVDAYSGIGITSMLFASMGKQVVSIEVVPKAVEDAKELAAINNLQNKIEFICGDCNNILPKLKVGSNAAFFVDPPRKGLGTKVCDTILKFKPQRIIYLSCNPQTLAADLIQLKSGGYKVEELRAYDMFPNTKHLESLVLLTR